MQIKMKVVVVLKTNLIDQVYFNIVKNIILNSLNIQP